MSDPLAAPVQFVKGVGPARAKALEGAGIKSVEDLILYAPRRYIDRRHCTPVSDLVEGMQVTILAEVLAAGATRGRRSRFIARAGDGSGIVDCVWFRGVPYVKTALRTGDLVVFSGKVSAYKGKLQLAHPEFEVAGSADDLEDGEDPLEDALHAGGLIPIYPLSAELRAVGLASRGLRRIIRNTLDSLDDQVVDPLPEKQRSQRDLMPLAEALEELHFPSTIETAERARIRLAYEEFFFMELLLAERSRNVQLREGNAFRTWGPLVRSYLERLEFTLTGAQQKVLAEIFENMGSRRPMNRLLQGDVGSGKTVIAACVMLTAVENGMQAALMAPTEILSEQHAHRLSQEFAALDVEVYLLTSRLSSSQRREILDQLLSGTPAVVIGTHALIQKDVNFASLGAVVVDEQHRFGVLQRGALLAKGSDPDVLVMTATPIPRTLAMTLYGDLETSIIDEMPPGREPVETHWISLDKRDQVVKRVRRALEDGEQAYWVFPLVEETERTDLRAAVESFEALRSGPLKDHVLGLIHGRMKSEEKDEVMNRFRSGDISLLISTTVIEVGVDVAGAAMILVEHAERFGLSQLHQLRGRVGRGSGKAVCVLLTGEDITEDAARRLQVMTETNDGFQIAEADLEIRGPGEFFGTRQHGLPDLRIASLVGDQELLVQARTDAFAALGLGDDHDRSGIPTVGNDVLGRWREILQRRMDRKISLADIA